MRWSQVSVASILVASILLGAPPVAAGVIRGVVVDDAGKPVGDAVVQVGAAAGEELVAVTDADGRFLVTVPPGTYRVVAATTDGATELGDVVVRHDSLEGEPDEVVVELALAATSGAVLVVGSVGGGVTYDADDVDWRPAEPRLVAPPWSRPSSALLWRRDHLGLAALDARLDPTGLATTLDGGARLPGSPGLAVEFLDEPGFALAAPAIGAPGATGGTAPLAVRFGDQRRRGDVRASLGPHGRVAAVAAEVPEPGELAMTFGGVAERRPDDAGAGGPAFVGQALWATRLDVDRTSGHMIGLVTGSADGSEDYWGDVALTRRSEDGRRHLTVGLTAAQLEGPEEGASTARVLDPIGADRFAEVSRFAGRIGVEDERGSHHLTIGGEVGGGRADDAVHTDVSAYVGDQWARRRDLTVEVGLRWALRSLGSAQRAAWQPRAAAVWRPDAEARLVVTATAERVATFDQRHLGAWRGGAATVDQLAAHLSGGLWRDRLGWRVGVRARSPDATLGTAPDLGVDGSLELQLGTALAAQATFSTLERAAAAQLAATVCVGTFAAIARAAPDAVRWGVAFERSLRGDETLPLELGAELFDLDDADQRSAQVTLRRSW